MLPMVVLLRAMRNILMAGSYSARVCGLERRARGTNRLGLLAAG